MTAAVLLCHRYQQARECGERPLQVHGDLLSLEATATGQGPQCFRPATPLVLPAWELALRTHPDRQFADYILSGIHKGVHIGTDRTKRLHPARDGNLPSVQSLATLASQHIQQESSTGRLLGPLPQLLVSDCQVSPIGLIPKPHQPGKWHLIVDLSSPHGRSVNDAISVECCHMHYTSILEAASLIRRLGKGASLAKINLHQAYRMVPVHADDHHLLAIRWQNRVFVDTALPFGLRSAPQIFPAFTDALALQNAGISPAGYSGHSFRIGAATTAAQAGLEDSVVKTLGRWESAAYQQYIQTPRETLAAFSAR